MTLLNYYSQTKMAKGEAFGYKTAILHFAPYNMSGKNVCPKATKGPGGCIAPCLNTSGRGQMGSVQRARINKTNYFWNNKNGFLWELSKEIELLKAEGIKGLVLDLRNNGGGSLKTVVDIGGLFIDEGPIVQVRSAGNNNEVLNDKQSGIDWDGPLVILVNELSASASEILAAAMQDYKRAIVIGSKQTYGKGTVQNIIDLNRMIRSNTNGDMGAFKFTTQKYYRINGGSTQLEGVKSDILVP